MSHSNALRDHALDPRTHGYPYDSSKEDAKRFVTMEANEIHGLPMALNLVSMSRKQWEERLPLITAFAKKRKVFFLEGRYWKEMTHQAHFDLPVDHYKIEP